MKILYRIEEKVDNTVLEAENWVCKRERNRWI